MRGLPVLLSAALAAALASSCAPVGPPGDSAAAARRPSERKLYKWYDDGGEGKVAIRISLTDQIAEVTRGDRDIGWCYVATGKEGHDTRPGSYTITEKIADKHSNLYGWFEDEYGNVTNGDARSRDKVPPGERYVAAPMPYWMRLTSTGVGMHGGLIPEPGEPASHGCIRMPKTFVPQLFSVTNVGTPVTITNEPSRSGREAPASVPRNDWGTYRESYGSVGSVTYHNGQPVSYQ